ncbi:MAG: hypothetical protein B6I36_02295 [Desulfobacteraceae bacterium 4572_35.1]|nr:MAG: hypothetical protein B6I36_02295 [Desulfobacteraceae bacterium 4572_35.1]
MNALKLMLSSMWGFVKPFARQFLTKAGPVLAKAAMEAVTVTATMHGSASHEKRDKAYDLIIDDLKQQGVAMGTDVSTSMVNAAIEVAVQNLKDK